MKTLTATLFIAAFAPLMAADLRHDPTPTVCKTMWPVEACYTVNGSKVQVSVKSLEVQADFQPITGFWVEGRIQLSDGSFAPFRVSITRDNWDGPNTATVTLPADFQPTSVARLTVIVRRDAETCIVY